MRRLTLLLILAACKTGPPPEMEDAVVAVLEEPDRFVLYSLYPYRDQQLLGEQERLGGYPVLGKTELNEAEREQVLAALWKGFREKEGTAATGFSPRYAIRADRGEETVYFLICFECFYANWYFADKQAGGRATTADAEEVFEAVLKAHDVPLAQK